MKTETRYLAEELNLATSKIEHVVVIVDAPTAERWLVRNVNNRPVRQSVVERYRRDMVDGRWLFSADPVRFNVDGDLIDGQHRLTALAECDDLSLPMLVVRGLPRDTQGVMDQGAKRTPGDQLTLLGLKDAHATAAAVKQLLIWEEGLLFRDTKAWQAISAPRIEEWVVDHPQDAEFLRSVIGETKRSDAPPAIAAAAAIVFGRIDEEAAAQFFRLLVRGAGTEGHPIVTLDKRLQRIRRDGLKVSNRDYLALFIQAWNAWRAGRTISVFPRPKGASWHEANFPVPS